MLQPCKPYCVTRKWDFLVGAMKTLYTTFILRLLQNPEHNNTLNYSIAFFRNSKFIALVSLETEQQTKWGKQQDEGDIFDTLLVPIAVCCMLQNVAITVIAHQFTMKHCASLQFTLHAAANNGSMREKKSHLNVEAKPQQLFAVSIWTTNKKTYTKNQDLFFLVLVLLRLTLGYSDFYPIFSVCHSNHATKTLFSSVYVEIFCF